LYTEKYVQYYKQYDEFRTVSCAQNMYLNEIVHREIRAIL